jgi:hypothetical protein
MRKFIPYTSEEIVKDLEDRVIQQGIIQEVDLQTGSNVKQIIDLMGYVGSVINTNTTYGVNEMILTQATKRQNILKNARQLGYEPHRKYSFIYQIRIQVQEDGKVVIPSFTRFTGGGKMYYFMGSSIEGLYTAGDIIDIEVKEGLLMHYVEDIGLSFLSDPNNELPEINGVEPFDGKSFDIDYDSLEEDGIDVWVSEPPYKSNQRWAKKAHNLDVPLEAIDGLDNTYTIVRNIESRNVKVVFGHNGIGRTPIEGANVNIIALISNGINGKCESIISLDDEHTTNIAVLGDFQKVVRTGMEEESDDSIKENAPLFHSSAYRAVTADDYKVMLRKNSLIDTAQVWGGEETFPPILGHVWTSMITNKLSDSTLNLYAGDYDRKFDNVVNIEDMYVESLDIDTMLNDLNRYKIITIQTHHEQPKFMRINFEVNIVNESFNLDEIKQKMADTLFELFTNKYEKFDSSFYESNIIAELDHILGNKNGIEISTKTFIDITFKDLTPIVSYDDYWEVGEEDRYINTCGICLNDEYSSDYGSDVTMFLAFPHEDMFDTSDYSLIHENLPQIDTDNFLQNIGLNIPDENNLYVDWDGGFKTFSQVDQFMTFPIMFNGKISGRYNIINTYKRKYIQVILYVGSRSGETRIDRYDESGLLDTHFQESTQKINIVYKTPNIKFLKNTIPLLNKISFV